MFRVFKTSVQNHADVEMLTPFLPAPHATKWSFDLEDCDKVFRIDAKVAMQELLEIFSGNGFLLEELPD